MVIIGFSTFILEEVTTKFPVAKSIAPHMTAAINAPRMKPKKLPLSSSTILPSTHSEGPTADSPIIATNNLLLIWFPRGPQCCNAADDCRARGAEGTKYADLVFYYAMSGHAEAVTTRMTAQAFAVLGNGQIGYVKPIRSENAARFFPELTLAPGIELFALHAADGTPLMIAANRTAAVASAREYMLDPVSVH